jgi:hypothetical protein
MLYKYSLAIEKAVAHPQRASWVVGFGCGSAGF